MVASYATIRRGDRMGPGPDHGEGRTSEEVLASASESRGDPEATERHPLLDRSAGVRAVAERAGAPEEVAIRPYTSSVDTTAPAPPISSVCVLHYSHVTTL